MNKVLVIEDEQDIAKLVQLHLQDLPCKVSLAFDGIVGSAEAEAKPYDLVILDLKLPGIDGLEVCRRLRARRTLHADPDADLEVERARSRARPRDGRRRLPDQALQRHGTDGAGEGAVPRVSSCSARRKTATRRACCRRAT